MTDIFNFNSEYKQWLDNLKLRIQQSQFKAMVAVNTELLNLYWNIGIAIVDKQVNSQWGEGLINQLSKDLKKEFPHLEGFSPSNLWFIRRWYFFYNESITKLSQAVTVLDAETLKELSPVIARLLNEVKNVNNTWEINVLLQKIQELIAKIPWGHNREIISKCKTLDEALFYVQKAATNGWSRAVLVHQIEYSLYQREGKAVTNFVDILPQLQSDLVGQTLKDPYIFDFLSLSKEYKERELEDVLVANITKFLLELGTGFTYYGRQVHIKVGDIDFYIDLLFYHLKLRCYVVIELKVVEFLPEFVGKLNFYITAVDRQLKQANDNPTIGILICKSKNDIVVEYALDNINKPIGVSSYELTKLFPEDFKGSLPTIEEIEEELKEGLKNN